MLIKDASKSVLIYVLMYIAVILVQVVVVFGGFVDVNSTEELIRFNSINNLGFYGLMAILYIALFKQAWNHELNHFKANKFQFIKYMLFGFLAMIGVSLLMNAIYLLLGITDQSENQAQLDMLLQGAFFDKFALVAFAVFLAPIVEEMVFRMAIFKFLEKGYFSKPWLKILISSSVFGFIHVMGAFDFEQIFYYIGLGAVLGAFYHKTDNIIVPIIVHMLLNGFVTITMFLSL